MGRYYNGDIQGKFWFAVQPSDAASRFGGQMIEPQVINFFFDSDDLESIQGELKRIEQNTDLEKIEKFFETNNGYTNEELDEAGITSNDVAEYADYLLGKNIEKCVLDIGECSFEAEL